MVDSEYINDEFNLFGEEEVIHLDANNYESVYIAEPSDKSEFTLNAESGELFGSGESNHTQLAIVRSREDKNKFIVTRDYVKNGIVGRIVTIDEDTLHAMEAKRRLTDGDE